LKGQTATNTSDIDVLKGQSAVNTTNITNVTTTVNTHTSNIAALNGQVSTLQGQTATNTTDITDLKGRTTANTTSITNLTNTVTTQGTTISNVQNTVKNHGTDITGLKATTATHTATLGNHGTRITRLEGRTDGLEQRMGDVESQVFNTVGGFDSRITGAEQTAARAENKADKALEGVAVALSLQDPVLANGDSFGVRMNWGMYGGENALGMTALGVLDRNAFGDGETLSFGGGIGVGLDDGNVGGRLGMQLTFK
jgi:chromosome segregation ATPase